MLLKGKKRFERELEKFCVTELRKYDEKLPYTDDDERFENDFPKLTNHEICHEMFWNAFRGRSRMYIQIEGLNFDEEMFYDEAGGHEAVVIQGSLLTEQMLEYDRLMFGAMSDNEDEEYSMAAKRHYHPYLFSFVAEVDREQYKVLKGLQSDPAGSFSAKEGDLPSPYRWWSCTFDPEGRKPDFKLDGYVVQSASDITKHKETLYFIKEEREETVKSILSKYKLHNPCLTDKEFIEKIKGQLGNSGLSTIDVYKIGNGNCVFAQSEDKKVRFFFDIGFNYRHRPNLIGSGTSKPYSYNDTIKKIYAQDPTFFILSHWHMDHIAGGIAASNKFIDDKDWFAPDCYDACIDAKRFAKYLDLKGRLHLAKRPSREKTLCARLIGHIDVPTPEGKVLYKYKLYMGEKAACDGSLPNCEGIVIEYMDKVKEKNVLMMGDVNYASFNKALKNQNTNFADTKIDYLIVPHHGSEHTEYGQITNSSNTKKGKKAIICCTDDTAINRPNSKHKAELLVRFDEVCATENVKEKHSI